MVSQYALGDGDLCKGNLLTQVWILITMAQSMSQMETHKQIQIVLCLQGGHLDGH